ncbi:hypothetical protein Lal_00023397 [Lupinus albus]|nr:hypothetical protein Lal_00023397 [Lupinus albus]
MGYDSNGPKPIEFNGPLNPVEFNGFVTFTSSRTIVRVSNEFEIFEIIIIILFLFNLRYRIISNLFTMSRSGQPPDLKKYMDKKLQIKLNANRMIVGTLRGFDQFMNLVVDNTVEVNGTEKTDIGMVVIRGNSVVTVEALEPVNRT